MSTIKSIEEKAKAYDEAYKKVAIRFGSNVADEIFLKESEYERIRKELIEFCKNRAEYYPNDPKYKNISAWIAWLEKQSEQKSVWGEEDEKIALSIEQVMNCASLLNIAPENINKIRTWLKSLKARVQPKLKQEWSEEDEEMFDAVISDLERHGGKEGSCYSAEINWLKSFKEKCT